MATSGCVLRELSPAILNRRARARARVTGRTACLMRARVRARVCATERARMCVYTSDGNPRDRPINQAPLLARQSFAIAIRSEGTLSIPLGYDFSVCQDGTRAKYFFFSLSVYNSRYAQRTCSCFLDYKIFLSWDSNLFTCI